MAGFNNNARFLLPPLFPAPEVTTGTTEGKKSTEWCRPNNSYQLKALDGILLEGETIFEAIVTPGLPPVRMHLESNETAVGRVYTNQPFLQQHDPYFGPTNQLTEHSCTYHRIQVLASLGGPNRNAYIGQMQTGLRQPPSDRVLCADTDVMAWINNSASESEREEKIRAGDERQKCLDGSSTTFEFCCTTFTTFPNDFFAGMEDTVDSLIIAQPSNLTTLENTGYQGLRKLQCLSIWSNTGGGEIEIDCANFPRLEELYLHGGSAFSLKNLAGLTMLKELEFNDDLLHKDGNLPLPESLLELKFSNVQLENLKAFANLTNLIRLTVDVETADGIDKLKDLEILDIHVKKGNHLPGIEQCSNLVYIDLGFGSTDFRVSGMEELTELRGLEIQLPENVERHAFINNNYEALRQLNTREIFKARWFEDDYSDNPLIDLASFEKEWRHWKPIVENLIGQLECLQLESSKAQQESERQAEEQARKLQNLEERLESSQLEISMVKQHYAQHKEQLAALSLDNLMARQQNEHHAEEQAKKLQNLEERLESSNSHMQAQLENIAQANAEPNRHFERKKEIQIAIHNQMERIAADPKRQFFFTNAYLLAYGMLNRAISANPQVAGMGKIKLESPGQTLTDVLSSGSGVGSALLPDINQVASVVLSGDPISKIFQWVLDAYNLRLINLKNSALARMLENEHERQFEFCHTAARALAEMRTDVPLRGPSATGSGTGKKPARHPQGWQKVKDKIQGLRAKMDGAAVDNIEDTLNLITIAAIMAQFMIGIATGKTTAKHSGKGKQPAAPASLEKKLEEGLEWLKNEHKDGKFKFDKEKIIWGIKKKNYTEEVKAAKAAKAAAPPTVQLMPTSTSGGIQTLIQRVNKLNGASSGEDVVNALKMMAQQAQLQNINDKKRSETVAKLQESNHDLTKKLMELSLENEALRKQVGNAVKRKASDQDLNDKLNVGKYFKTGP